MLTSLCFLCSVICLYLSTIGFVIGLFGEALPFAMYIGLATVSGALSMAFRGKKTFLRLLPTVLTLAFFYKVPSAAAAVLPLPIIFYLGMTAKEGFWELDHWHVKNLFISALKVYGVFLPVFLLLGHSRALMQNSAPYFAAYLLLSVFCLRQLRSEHLSRFGAAYKLLNIILPACIGLLCLLLSSRGFLDMCLGAAGFVYEHILSPAVYALIVAIVFLPSVISYLAGLLISKFNPDVEPPKLDLSGNAENIFGETELIQQGSGMVGKILAGIAIALFLIILLRIIYRHFRFSGSHPTYGTGFEHAAVERQNVPSRRAAFFDSSPEGVVRAQFRRFLLLCREKGIEVDGKLASDEICEKSALYMGPSAQFRLRSLWLRARFCRENGLTADDAAAAKQLVKELKSSAKRPEKP